jgi:hypothetical protein
MRPAAAHCWTKPFLSTQDGRIRALVGQEESAETAYAARRLVTTPQLTLVADMQAPGRAPPEKGIACVEDVVVWPYNVWCADDLKWWFIH